MSKTYRKERRKTPKTPEKRPIQALARQITDEQEDQHGRS